MELERSAVAARQCTDSVGEQNVYASRLRALLQEGRLADACALERQTFRMRCPACAVKSSRRVLSRSAVSGVARRFASFLTSCLA